MPAEIDSDANAREVLRAWVANGGLVCALRPEIWKDTAAWGMLLADLARHVADAVKELDGSDTVNTIQRIRDMFNAELDNPTDEPKGHFE